MSIKVTKETQTPKAITSYPAIGISDNTLIVLFYAHGRGTVLTGGGEDDARYSDDWSMSSFELYQGTITLSNT